MKNCIHEPCPTISTARNEVDLLNPDPATIDLRDISEALSCIVRYTGHTDWTVTVMQHLAICDMIAFKALGITDPLTRLAVLLHDAHEAYTGDMSRPLKRHLDAASGGAITKMEEGLDRAIWEALGLDYGLVTPDVHATVKKVDNLALSAEVRTAWPVIVAEDRWMGLEHIDRDILVATKGVWDIDLDKLTENYARAVMGLAQSVAASTDARRGRAMATFDDSQEESHRVH